ncbi:hypothetical protein ACFRCI_32555 [Streptomyces sp. NPDC056638]|uniref:hypothetical protein n=1 Tax=Streptomyces sp. NPDC056638 TaxID=3345887 RepID=UPI0036BC1332
MVDSIAAHRSWWVSGGKQTVTISFAMGCLFFRWTELHADMKGTGLARPFPRPATRSKAGAVISVCLV